VSHWLTCLTESWCEQHPFIALACTREEFALAVQQRVSFTKW